MLTKPAAFICLFMFCLFSTQAQDYVELGQLGYRYSFKTSPDNDTARSVSGARVNVLLPLKISGKTYLLPGFRFWQYNIEPGENLKWYLFQFGIQTQLNDQWSLQVLPMFRSGIYNQGSFGDGFQYGIMASATKQIRDGLALGFGIYTNHELFGQLFTPFMTIDWNITDRWRLFGSFPMFNTLSYSINKRWNTGINFIGLVTTFSSGETYIERQSLDFSAFLEYYITPRIVAQARIGYPVGRKFEEYDKDDKVNFTLSLIRFGENRELLRTFDESQLFAAVHLFFRVKK